MSHFGLMSDGIHAVDCNPWPNIGTIDLEQSRYHFVANGCWPSVSPDESGRFFTFRGNHRSIWMFNKLKSEGTAVQLDTISDAPGPTVYHPRWTNHPQVITVTAPLGHPQSKLYLGKFDSSFANIDSWRRITYADKPDAFGNAWIATGITATAPPKLISQTKETIEEPATAQRQGLVFIWENQRADNAIIDEHGKTLRLCRATFHGHARPSPTQGGDLRDGALVADDESSRSIALAAAKSNAMTLNFVTQTNEGTRDGVIASYGSPGQPAALLVEQKNSQLHATITATGGTFSIALGQVQPGTPQHWSLVLDASGLHAFQNGKPTASTEAKLNLSSWQPAVLRFGQASDGSGTWRGWIEEIELYDRPLGEKEVAAIHASAAADWAKRKPAPRIVVEAELVEASKTPDPANIRPYQRSLAENLYRVKKVISGELKEDRIIVLQWCILDSQKIEASRSPGTVVTLTLEADEDHTELGGENRSSDLIDPGLPVLYDVGS